MNISQLQALFAQIDINKDKSISSQEMQKSSYSSIFGGYFQNNTNVDFETFNSTIGSNKHMQAKLEDPNQKEQEDSPKNTVATNPQCPDGTTPKPSSVQREVPYSQNESVELSCIPEDTNEEHIWWGDEGTDLRGNDASKLDLSRSKDLLLKSSFDTNTKFPPIDKMPADFNPQEILENGKSPGLGIENLHKQGLTGKGANVALIDLPMNVNQSEFKDNIVNYQEFGVDPNLGSEMHGYATTSILAGKNIGVAPDAKITYFADKFSEGNSTTGEMENSNKYVTQSLNKIYEMNKNLSKDKQINAVSLSWGPNMQASDYSDFINSIKKLEDSGVFVQYNDDDNPNSKLRFGGLDRDPQGNPDDVSSYKLSELYTGGMENFTNRYKGNALLIPAGHRTTAGPTGEKDYVNYAAGGVSWQIPYIVGVYSLAKQANPKLTPDEFRQKSLETGTPYYSPSGQLVGKIINPKKLLKKIR